MQMCKELYKCKFMIMIDETQIYILRTNEKCVLIFFLVSTSKQARLIPNRDTTAWTLRGSISLWNERERCE